MGDIVCLQCKAFPPLCHCGRNQLFIATCMWYVCAVCRCTCHLRWLRQPPRAPSSGASKVTEGFLQIATTGATRSQNCPVQEGSAGAAWFPHAKRVSVARLMNLCPAPSCGWHVQNAVSYAAASLIYPARRPDRNRVRPADGHGRHCPNARGFCRCLWSSEPVR